jgi:hypothetical protein
MKKIAAALSLALCSTAFAGPFGLSMGMSLEQLKKQGKITLTEHKFTYQTTSLIGGHPDYQLYSLFLTPKQGLCKILAASKTINSGSSGRELIEKYDRTVASLTRKYGAPTGSDDSLDEGSIWNEPRDWMMSLLKKERTIWTSFSNRQDSINVLSVSPVALSGESGIINIIYAFDNVYKCVEESNVSKDSKF